ncbi:hypothetical protein HDV06_006391 [Boothiomyces sp. JEL0866]|nr:hypothetical protein HDV06_006391 [Boothiomyces sp. JEL0866]
MSYTNKVGHADPLPPVRTLPEYLERRMKLKSGGASKYSEKSLRCLDDLKAPVDKFLSKTFKNVEEKKVDAKEPAAMTPPITMGHQELKLLGEHVASIASKLRFNHTEEEIRDLVIEEDDYNANTSESDIATDVGKVEKAVYPGFDKITVPSEKPPVRYMSEAIRKHRHLSLIDMVSQPEATQLFHDLYWYIWCRFWDNANADIRRLYDRISINYFKIFVTLKQAEKDSFFQIFPDIIGYAVLLALKECHPNSIDTFNKNFQMKLCDIIFQLLSGIPPAISPTWPVEEDEPKIVEEKVSDENKFGAILISDKFTDEDIIKYQEEKSKGSIAKIIVRKEKKVVSSVFGVKPKSKMLDFNIFQNSPVIKNYLLKCGASWEPKKITISRREMVHDVPNPDQQTYRQLLHDSYRSSKNHILKYKLNLDEIIKERNRIAHDSAIQINYEQDKLAKILMNPESIKLTADHILDMHSTRAKYNITKQNVMPFIRAPLVE